MNLKKYLLLGGVALGLGMTSCVGDLDLEPNDPNLVNTSDPNFKANALGICYSGIAVSGISGSGSSYVAGLDAGTSAYLRLLFTLGEFPTDELVWIWPHDEAGSIGDLVACTWSSNNTLCYGAYYRLLGHIAICNQFLTNTADDTDAETIEMRAEARVLRAFSYYNMIDLFGQSSFITEEAELGSDPIQISRAELFTWIEKELTEIVDQKLISEKPIYGRVGLDGAEALLARLYLNAEVFSGKARWADCQARCENIINRHKGTGFEGTGLAKEYLYLFCKDNKQFMPGGTNADENEILFGISYDADMTQSYGGPTFIVAGTITNSHYVPRQYYGCSGEWSCIKGIQQMAERFYGLDNDKRDDLWIRGLKPGGSDAAGNSWDSEDYTDTFLGFTGAWATTGGNAIIKFTGNTVSPNPGEYNKERPLAIFDGEYYTTEDGTLAWNPNYGATVFMSTDQPIIRLADIYLMYTECFINGSVGDRQKALDYINYVRKRAGSPAFSSAELTKKNLMDERSRELYLESTRRTDLIRNGMFVGPSQTVWQVKGNINNMDGTRIDDKYALYPIPDAVLNSQPDFKQNPGY